MEALCKVYGTVFTYTMWKAPFPNAHVIDYTMSADRLVSRSHTCSEEYCVMGRMGNEGHSFARLMLNIKILFPILCNLTEFKQNFPFQMDAY